MADSVLPFRPLPAEPPDTLLGLLEAAEGLPDATIARLIDHYGFSDVWEPGFFATPQSDGRRLHAIPCGAVAGPDYGGLTAGELPSEADIDRAVALARTGSRPTLEEIR